MENLMFKYVELTSQIELNSYEVKETPTAAAMREAGFEGELLRAMNLGLIETAPGTEEVYGCKISCSGCSAGSSGCNCSNSCGNSCVGCSSTFKGSDELDQIVPSENELLMALAE
jgi:hypothetical protein